MNDEIRKLINESQYGNTHAFGELISLYSNYVFSVVHRIINNETQAEDLVQETFIKAWINLSNYDTGKSKFTTWLFTIATRISFDWMKKNKQVIHLDESTADKIDSLVATDQLLSNDDIALLISLACRQLSDQQKVVFVLRDLEQMDVDEVCEITGFSEKKVNDTLYIARKNISHQLKNYIKMEL